MDTTKNISLHAAFAHCASTGSYWLWIGIALVLAVGMLYVLTRANNQSEVDGRVKMAVYFFALAIVLCSIFVRPCTVSQNTSEAMAARGHYLGY